MPLDPGTTNRTSIRTSRFRATGDSTRTSDARCECAAIVVRLTTSPARLPTVLCNRAVESSRSHSRETVRSAKRTVIQTCQQCGAINQDGAEVCCFCEESLAQEHALVVSSAAGSSSGGGGFSFAVCSSRAGIHVARGSLPKTQLVSRPAARRGRRRRVPCNRRCPLNPPLRFDRSACHSHGRRTRRSPADSAGKCCRAN